MPDRPIDSAVLVVNAGSRRGSARDVGDAVRAAGIPLAAEHVVRRDDDLESVLDRALADAPDLLVVGGGDGTVSCAAGRVAGSRTVLGVLPLGTANDLARTLEIPDDLREACAVLADGTVVDIDLGRADSRPFLNVASVGLSVEVTGALSPTLKRRLGPLAYPVAAVRAYRRHQPFAARLEFPDGDHPTLEVDDLLQVSIGNGRHFGGGATVAPHADIDDHMLDVDVVEHGRLRDHVSMARLLRTGHFIEHEKVHHRATRRVRLVTEPALRINMDGEITGQTPTTFEVQRNAVHVVVPQHATGARFDGA
ncbi:lipid kinase [Actinotalea sp. Marseille-Q4924]|uniref:lipid kinase n=1 Tax=Actinotalea sp. Marseille-Q4924 TaxID=2866571 RepID=UPI001CE40C20|nr:lipid kinase [Actinotalea sp. Marseille-Q4924]